MCGIFGTTNPLHDLQLLIDANSSRGVKSLSLFTPRIRLVVDGPPIPTPLSIVDELWVLGHWHSPTGEPNFDRHPFQYKQWFVGHNGHIHNWQSLFGLVWDGLSRNFPYKTDSCVIPYLLQEEGFEGLGELDGPFACWARDSYKRETYLFSWVNPIYTTQTCFSSTSIPSLNLTEDTILQEGLVIRWPSLTLVGGFEAKGHPYK